MITDVNTFLGNYPFRRVPGTSPEALLSAMTRVGITDAWVSHLPSLWERNPPEENRWLYETTSRFPRLRPVPAVHPGLEGWEAVLQEAVEKEAPAIRVAPGQFGISPTGPAMVQLVRSCAAVGMPVVLAVRLEDGRQ